MAYSTLNDMKTRRPVLWLQVLDSDGDGVLSPEEEAAASSDRDWGEGVINSYVGRKYDLPLPSVPPILVDVEIDLAFYRAASTADRMSEIIEKNYKAAMEWLRDIAKGDASLGLPDPPPSHGPGVSVVTNEREFTKAKWGAL